MTGPWPLLVHVWGPMMDEGTSLDGRLHTNRHVILARVIGHYSMGMTLQCQSQKGCCRDGNMAGIGVGEDKSLMK